MSSETDTMKGIVLAIDDEEDILEFLEILLGARGFSVLTAASGRVGIELARDEHPQVILLDIMMPEMDGHEVCRDLKSDPNTAQIPVLMLTAMNRVDDIAASMEEGADGFMAKPFDNDSLVDAIERMLMPGGRMPLFYVSKDSSAVPLRRMEEYEAGNRVVCMRVIEDGPTSSFEDAAVLHGAYLMSIAQEERPDDQRLVTSALLEVEAPQAFGETLNGIHARGGKVVFCRIFRDILEVPFYILPRSERNE